MSGRNPTTSSDGAKPDGRKVVATNRRARFDYHLGDRYEAGLVLTGTEVKALRANKASLAQAWVKVMDGQAWLMQAHIEEYDHGHRENHDPTRERKLLLHAREIGRLEKEVGTKGITLVPTSLYFRRGLAKLEFAVGTGKSTQDKRQTIADRDAKREVERAIKNRRR